MLYIRLLRPIYPVSTSINNMIRLDTSEYTLLILTFLDHEHYCKVNLLHLNHYLDFLFVPSRPLMM